MIGGGGEEGKARRNKARFSSKRNLEVVFSLNLSSNIYKYT